MNPNVLIGRCYKMTPDTGTYNRIDCLYYKMSTRSYLFTTGGIQVGGIELRNKPMSVGCLYLYGLRLVDRKPCGLIRPTPGIGSNVYLEAILLSDF